jgi:flagellar motor protein MotB
VMKKFSLRKIKGKALDSLISKKDVLIIARNQFYNDTVLTDDEGKFELNVPEKIPLQIMARKKGYLTDMVEIVVDENTNEVAIALLPIRLQQSIQMKSINFVGNKCIVLPKSVFALENLREQIKINDHFCFEIQGHVNAPRVSSLEVNKYMALSKARAGTVYAYLINANIDKTRMYCEGYGHLKMLYPQAIYEREMSLNRRVELKVHDCTYVAEKRKTFDEETYLKLSKSKSFIQMEY